MTIVGALVALMHLLLHPGSTVSVNGYYKNL